MLKPILCEKRATPVFMRLLEIFKYYKMQRKTFNFDCSYIIRTFLTT